MSSVEGMWAIYMPDVFDGSSGATNSGVMVLETGRIFGGDSLIAYLGHYRVNAGIFTAEARTWSYNPGHYVVVNVFGREGKLDTRTCFEGRMDGDAIVGEIWEVERPHLRLPARLVRIADLP